MPRQTPFRWINTTRDFAELTLGPVRGAGRCPTALVLKRLNILELLGLVISHHVCDEMENCVSAYAYCYKLINKYPSIDVPLYILVQRAGGYLPGRYE